MRQFVRDVPVAARGDVPCAKGDGCSDGRDDGEEKARFFVRKDGV